MVHVSLLKSCDLLHKIVCLLLPLDNNIHFVERHMVYMNTAQVGDLILTLCLEIHLYISNLVQYIEENCIFRIERFCVHVMSIFAKCVKLHFHLYMYVYVCVSVSYQDRLGEMKCFHSYICVCIIRLDH